MGVLLLKRHPEVATRDCRLCQKWIFDEETGLRTLDRDGKPEPRFFACPPPCQTDRGCPKGTPEKSRSLNKRNEQCYQHYCECRAVGQFPDEPVVRRNAAIIREVEDRVDRLQQQDFQRSLLEAMILK